MDEVDYALDIGAKLLELVRSCNKSVKGFRSRAREMPQMVQQLGLIPSLTFLLSKIDDKLLLPSIQYFVKGKGVGEKEKLCDEVEEEGYTSYLVVSFAWVKLKLNDIKFFDKCDFDESVDVVSYIKEDYISTLKTLKNDGNLLANIEGSVLNLSIELKKIVDGVYGGEGDRRSS
ncbi:type III-B CRISPR module-associated protein Cmr5 [Stygiolobus caldivivus]|uniref:CRISPR type III-B/RAMP module-associated protein Cmr5 n=1 Tax=Stygiolobus caldivivus TaxID=2824673 RepID=A0A8D5U4I3_9CREN|nr:type III-B CRISPR module-associated protein Cmr5 [Stygiolobus caldivivus]BCU68781.1 hypothetical protein KN1_00780 [Stygiolobus caldivivus]